MKVLYLQGCVFWAPLSVLLMGKLNFRLLWGCTLVFPFPSIFHLEKFWNLEKNYKNSTIHDEYSYTFHLDSPFLNIWPHSSSLSLSHLKKSFMKLTFLESPGQFFCICLILFPWLDLSQTFLARTQEGDVAFSSEVFKRFWQLYFNNILLFRKKIANVLNTHTRTPIGASSFVILISFSQVYHR